MDEPSVERLSADVKAARDEWLRAYEEVKQAFAPFLETLTHPADRHLTLKNARLRELLALKKYIAAVGLYGDVVLRAGGAMPPGIAGQLENTERAAKAEADVSEVEIAGLGSSAMLI